CAAGMASPPPTRSATTSRNRSGSRCWRRMSAAMPPWPEKGPPGPASWTIGRSCSGRQKVILHGAACGAPTACLAQVRMEREAYAERLRREARLVDRAANLRGYDHFRNPFVPGPDMPLATVPATRLATRTAWLFVTGEVDLALADACADIALGRRMLESGDSLISSLAGAT